MASDVEFVITGTVKIQRYTQTIPGVGEIVWDVNAAQAAVAAGDVLACVEVEHAQMLEIERRNRIDEAHLAEVDPSVPGIAAPLVWEGQIVYQIIDGTHRCVRALREGRPFFGWILSDEAARRCVLSSPPGLMPWEV